MFCLCKWCLTIRIHLLKQISVTKLTIFILILFLLISNLFLCQTQQITYENLNTLEHCPLMITHACANAHIQTVRPQHDSCCPAVHLIAVHCTLTLFLLSQKSPVHNPLIIHSSTTSMLRTVSCLWKMVSLDLVHVVCLHMVVSLCVCAYVCVQWARTGSIRRCLLLLLGGYCAQS